MEYLGRVHHGQINLENNAQLPEGSQVLVVVLDDEGAEPKGITGAQLLEAEFVGEWKDRDDIGDTAEFVEELRRRAQTRN